MTSKQSKILNIDELSKKIDNLEKLILDQNTLIENKSKRNLYEIIFHNSPSAMLFSSYDGEIYYINDAFSKITGYRPSDIEKIKTKDFYVDIKDRERLFEILKKNGNVTNFEARFYSKNKKIIYVRFSSNTLIYNGKSVLVSSFVDITEEKEAKSALKKGKEHYKMLFESVDSGVFISKKGTFIECNQNGALIFGLSSKDEIIGKTPHDFTPMKQPNGELSVDFIKKRQKETKENGFSKFDWVYKNKQGKKIYSYVELKRLDYMGKDYVLGIVRDTTELQKAKIELAKANKKLEQKVLKRTEELRKSEQKFSAIFESTTDAILVWDENISCIYANDSATKLLALEKKELFGEHIDFCLQYLEDYQKSWKGIIQQVFRTKKPIKYEEQAIAGGEEIFSESIFSPVIDDNKEVFAVSIIYRDVTERKLAELEIKEYSERLSMAKRAGQIGVWDWNLENNQLYWDDEMFMIYDFSKSEFSGYFDSWRKRVHPVDMKKMDVKIEEFIASKAVDFEQDFRIITQSGEVKHLKVVACKHFDNNGNLIGLTGLNWDITKRMLFEQALKESEERFRSIFENNHAVMLVVDPETGDIINANPAALEYYGYGYNKITSMQVNEINTMPKEAIKAEMTRSVEENKRHFLFKHKLADGTIRDVEVFSGPIKMGGETVLYSIIHDITKRVEMENKLKEMATTDMLTGLNNRREFYNLAKRELSISKRYKEPFSVLMMDLDNFKQVNDNYGHDVGDDVLIKMAKTSKDFLRQTDILARLGGEEFVAVLLKTDIKTATETAERLRKKIENITIKTDQGDLKFTISIGVTQIKNKEQSLKNLLKEADMALYQAKANGRNQVVAK